MLTVEQILTQLNTDDSPFLPREALEQAILQQETITPALLTIIENVVKDPQSIDVTPAFTYALYLLAQFREKRAIYRLLPPLFYFFTTINAINLSICRTIGLRYEF